MRTIKNEYKIIKADGSEIVDITNEVINITMDKGSVLTAGNGYTDNPISTMDITVKNTNDKLYSWHFEANKVKFAFEYELTGLGNNVYGSPFENTLNVVSFDNEYKANWLSGNIVFNKDIPVGAKVKLGISYIDTTEKNPLNHLANNQYSALIQKGNICYRKQYTTDVSTELHTLKGNSTDYIALDIPLSIISNYKVLTAMKSVNSKSLEYLYSLNLEDFYTKNLTELLGNFQTTDTVFVDRYEIYDKGLYAMSLEDINNMSLEQIYATKLEDLEYRLYFNRVLQDDEFVCIAITKETILEENFKFYGKITNAVTSDVETCSFQCTDLSYDLKEFIAGIDKFRKYFSDKDEEEKVYTVEEKIKFVNVTNNTIVTTYNELPVAAAGDKFELSNGQNYFECTVTTFNSPKNIVFSCPKPVANGGYSVYKRDYNFTLEKFIQNCLVDSNLKYNLFVKDFSDFAIIPKEATFQYQDLWSLLQAIVSKIGMFLGFEYTSSDTTYYDYLGNAKQGTDSYELVIKSLTINPSLTEKYTITEKDVEKSMSLIANGSMVVNSYAIKYYSSETSEYETVIVDDSEKATNTVIITAERNVIITDELLNVGDIIRVGLQYRTIKTVLDSQTYVVNLPFEEAGEFDFFTMTNSILKFGLKEASITQDNTSDIDTQEEAIRFGAVCLAQSNGIFATYKLSVLTKYYPNINNFDTIKIHMPRLNLLNRNMVVQAVSETNDRTTFLLCEILRLGVWKYYNMRTQTGANKIVTSEDIGTNDKFPPVTNLTALEPVIDRSGGYQVYTRVSWNKLIGRNVVSYEVQHKKSTEDWENAEKVMIKDNSTKIILKEQAIYDIRVKATGKEQFDGKWAFTSLDNSSLVVNPIQNRTWYIRLFENNFYFDYFLEFDKLGYTVSELDSSIDTIEIIPNENGSDEISWTNKINDSESLGLQTEILNRTINKKNLIMRGFNGYYSIRTVLGLPTGEGGYLDVSKFNNISGDGENTILKTFNSKYAIFDFVLIDSEIKKIKNLKIISDKNDNLSTTNIIGIKGFSTSPSLSNLKKTFYENIEVSFLNFDNTYSTTAFEGVANIAGCSSDGTKNGFSSCYSINSCYIKNVETGFFNCFKIFSNKVVNASFSKYSNSYASESADPTYQIPTNGGDNPNAGFNT